MGELDITALESWARQPGVLQLLADMLAADSGADFRDRVRDVLGGGRLCAAHSVGLLRITASKRGARSSGSLRRRRTPRRSSTARSACARGSTLEAGGLRTTPREPPTAKARLRAERAAVDLQRIRAAIAADEEVRTLVHEMLTAAFTKMADGVRNHAAEFIGEGRFVKAKITPELRAAMDGTPITSVMAETVFARIKRRADRGGIPRHDTRVPETAINV